MRPLTLHVSALSDSEYDLYTASLNDLATDNSTHNAHYDRTSVGAREVRAWLRGRYSNLPASDIDSILKLFCPNMLSSDTLSGGQFFAALRLVTHAESGKGVDRTLAFVQASPKPVNSPDVSRPLSPPKQPVQAPPSHPDRQRPTPLSPSPPETNPFVRMSTDLVAPPVPPADSGYHPQQRANKISHNPFLARDHSVDKTVPPANVPSLGKLPPLPPRKPSLLAIPHRRPSDAVPTMATSTANLTSPAGPPLIPVKPTHVMSPLMRQSLEASKHAQSMKRAEEQLDRERVLQVLKTTSSSSSASATTLGTRTRSLSPTKLPPKPSKGGAQGSGSGGSDDATYVPPLPRRRKPSLPTSTSSALSLEQVASATLLSPTGAPPRPPLPGRDVLSPGNGGSVSTTPTYANHPGPGPTRPPTHPRRRPSTSTEPNVNDSQPSAPPSPRTARSKSVTLSSPSSSIPPPPPRRKRPESMQLTPTSDGGELPVFSSVLPTQNAQSQMQTRTQTGTGTGISRHLSLTRGRHHEPSDPSTSTPSRIVSIQKTLSNLQLRAQPKLDAVRYKAEAGISKRGYVHHTHLGTTRWCEEGERGLIADARWAGTNVDRDPDSDPTTDDEPSSGEDRGTRRTRTATGGVGPCRNFLTESDNLKWPMGEGWKPL